MLKGVIGFMVSYSGLIVVNLFAQQVRINTMEQSFAGNRHTQLQADQNQFLCSKRIIVAAARTATGQH
jgi:hypothetical protein